MNQHLYLDGRARPLRIGLYGAALEIGRDGEILSLAPIARLRGVRCLGRVDWAGDALLACAAGAVPISFLRGERGVAHFLPARPPARCFGALIEEASLHPAWRERLEDWTDSELRHSLLAALKAKPAAWAPVSRLLAAGDVRLALRAGLRALAPADAPGGPSRRIWRCLRGDLHAWTVERLRREPLFLAHFGFSSDKPNVAETMTAVVSPILLGQAVEQAAREARRKGPAGPIDGSGAGGLAHRCALAFRHAEPMVAGRFERAFRRFERLVRDTAEEIEP